MKTCVIALTIAFICTSSLGQTQDSAKKSYSIDNCVNAFDPAKVESTKAGYQYWFVDKDFLNGRTVKMSVVAPHAATHPPHNHPEDEIFFVLEGHAEFFLEGRTKTAGSYTTFYCPPNLKHGIRNVGDDTLKYLVIKKYPQSRPDR